MEKKIMSHLEEQKLMKLLEIMERNPKAGIAEGYRRLCNMFDDLEYFYTAVSFGKDSVFMTNMAIMELQRRQWISGMMHSEDKAQIDKAQELMNRFSAVRKAGFASQREDDIEKFDKWVGMRIGVMSMDYEITFDQTRQLSLRFWKEFATDIKNIIPAGMTIESCEASNKSVKELKCNLDWVSDVPEENPKELSREEIEKMTFTELEDIYGKALVWGYGCYFSIAWENTGGTDDSRYLSFDPDKRGIWVNEPPINYDPFHEWCMTNQNMYQDWHGLPAPVQITPGMSDQLLRVEFSKYISSVIPTAMANGWPLKKFSSKTGEYV